MGSGRSVRARSLERQLTSTSGRTANAAATPNGNLSQYESLSKAVARADQLVQETQAEMESLQHSLETAPAAKRRHLQTQIAELQSELGLFQARQQALHGMLDFASGASGAGATSLRAQIDELARAVPAAVSGTTVRPASAMSASGRYAVLSVTTAMRSGVPAMPAP